MKTIRDIAEIARVSVSTASLALRDDPRVRTETRDRILEVARDLDYRPMRAARSLSSGKTWTLDVINPVSDVGLSSSFNSRFLHGVHDTAHQARYSVALRIVENEQGAVDSVARLIQERATDGVISMNPSDNEPLVELLADRGVPHVLLGRLAERMVCSVDNDNIAVAADATEHLIERGHVPILFWSGPGRHTFTMDRLDGYMQSLERHGMADGAMTCMSDGTGEAARRHVRELLEDGSPMRAILATSDVLAIGAMRGIRDAGRSIPGDIALMGMNNDDLTEYTDPRLSSVELHAFELGRRAADALLHLIGGTTEHVPRAIVPHAIVAREST